MFCLQPCGHTIISIVTIIVILTAATMEKDPFGFHDLVSEDYTGLFDLSDAERSINIYRN